MKYWTLSSECLERLKHNWDEYCNSRIEAVNDLYKRAVDDYRDEGNDDLSEDRYSYRSVQRWFNHHVNTSRKWADDCLEELKEEYQKFMDLLQMAYNDQFDSSDFGYMIVYDFHKFERRRERCYEISDRKFRVRFLAQTHWYKLNGRRRELELITGNPTFVVHEF